MSSSSPRADAERPHITDEQRRKHRNAIAPFWELVRRSMKGEDADMLIDWRQKTSKAMFDQDPELRRINELIKQEAEYEREARENRLNGATRP